MLQPSDFILVRSDKVETGAPRFNGGYLGSVACKSGVKNAVFDDVTDNDRLYGATVYRKVFWKVPGPLQNVMVHLTSPSTGDDSIFMFKGTPGNLESELTGAERKYGSAYLSNNLNAGQSTFNITVENIVEDIFKTGDTIYITDGAKEELIEGVSFGRLSNGFRVFLPEGVSIINDYKALTTYICSVIKIGNVSAGYTDPVITSSSGLWSGTINLDWNGVTDERWTIRFLDTRQFICTGSRIGTVGYGMVDANFVPVHTVPGSPPLHTPIQSPYFTIPSNSFAGSWQQGDTFVFTTSSPTVPIWYKRVVKPGCLSSSSIFTHRITGIDPSAL